MDVFRNTNYLLHLQCFVVGGVVSRFVTASDVESFALIGDQFQMWLNDYRIKIFNAAVIL